MSTALRALVAPGVLAGALVLVQQAPHHADAQRRRPAACPTGGVSDGDGHCVGTHTCRETSTLSLSTVTVSHDQKSNEERKATLDADRVFIAPADVSTLLGGYHGVSPA